MIPYLVLLVTNCDAVQKPSSQNLNMKLKAFFKLRNILSILWEGDHFKSSFKEILIMGAFKYVIYVNQIV